MLSGVLLAASVQEVVPYSWLTNQVGHGVTLHNSVTALPPPPPPPPVNEGLPFVYQGKFHALKRVCYGRARYLTGALCLLQQAEAAAGAQQNEAFEIDQWILDFANLFREQLNIEPDKHLDLTNMGWDKLQAALDSAVQSDQAPAIFDAAADKFQEVSAHGALLLNSCSPKTSHLMLCQSRPLCHICCK